MANGNRQQALMSTIQAASTLADATIGVARERNHQAQYTTAMTEAQRRIHDFEVELQQNPNYQEYDQAYTENIQSIHDSVAEEMQLDSRVRAQFDNQYTQLAEQSRQRVGEMARRRETAQERVRLEQSLERAAEFPDPVEAQVYVESLLDGMYQAGHINEGERYELSESWESRIVLNQAKQTADEVVLDAEDRDLGYTEALEFARDRENGLNDQQRAELVSYIRDQRQDWNVEFQNRDRAFNDEALQAYHDGYLTRRWLLDERNTAAWQSRQRWIDMLDARDAARESASSGAGVNRDASRNLQIRMEDRAQSGEDWFSLYNEGLGYVENGMMDPVDFRQFRTFNEQNNSSHPFHSARQAFDAMADEVGLGSVDRNNLWEHVSDQLQENYYYEGPDGQIHRIHDEDHRMSREEIREMAQNAARGIVYESDPSTTARELGRALERRTIRGRQERDLQSITRMLASGIGARGLIGYEQYDQALRSVAEDHERIIADVVGIDRAEEAVMDPMSGRYQFRVEDLWTRIGFNEFDDNGQPHPLGGEMTIEVYDPGSETWSRVNPDLLRREDGTSILDESVDVTTEQTQPRTQFGVPLDRGPEGEPTSPTQFNRTERQTTSPRPEQRPGESWADYRARVSMWEAEQQRQGR